MNILKYGILATIMWVLPTFVLSYFNSSLGSPLSYLSFALLICYGILSKKRGPLLYIFIILGLSYYILAGFNYSDYADKIYLTMIVKYLIVVVCGAQVLRDTSVKELYVFLLVGALSVIIHALFFPLYNAAFTPDYGRFSGFYMNPNYAGAICLMGLSFSFGQNDKRLKYGGYLLFTIAGFFTFSRYFLGMWIVMNFLSVFISKENLKILTIGVIGLVIIFVFSASLQLNAERFDAIKSIFSGEKMDTKTLQEDSRTDTWASYKDIILDKPVIGNGFGKLQGGHFGLYAGVHNSYLLVLGESGILPFLILISIYIYFLIMGYKKFRTEPHYFMLALALFTALLVTHNYFDRLSILFISMHFYLHLTEQTANNETLAVVS
ncbi:O-antigen ligase family protein [Flavihumibacter sp. R14]|nr:O-antigen ligase family protein [Flavihumibacter soli]